MTRDPFLKRVAAAYVLNEAEHLSRMCFVFPNKRSAAFFGNYLQGMLKPPALLPAAMTISDLVSELAPCAEASRFDLLFTLYTEYRKLSGAEVVEFDRFIFWGDMLIRDFDDVDRYLVDPEKLFVNVSRFREIRSNYLTPRQLEIIGRYWDGVEDYTEGVDRFWQHINDKHSPTKERFVRLWEILLPLYKAYNSSLRERSMASPGHIYRMAVEELDAHGGQKLGFDRIVFVGFNVLSASELEIFRLIDNEGTADFYWDIIDSAFTGSGNVTNKAMRFVTRNARRFPSRYDIHSDLPPTVPEVSIVGVPSRIGQAKAVAKVLDEMAADRFTDPKAAINTAVVLPDESLFLPLVGSVPDNFSPVNVTMGYPMRRTPVATFLKAVVSMHVRARKSSGKWYYFYEDLMSVLSNSLPEAVAPEDCRNILQRMRTQRRFMVEADMLCDNYPAMRSLFTPIESGQRLEATASYITGLLEWLRHGVGLLKSKRDARIQIEFINAYRYALDTLVSVAEHYGVTPDAITALRLIERAVGSEQITLKGDPLRGLQIMGVLESRALDFENVIMPSMNERIFPRKSFTRSFIPDSLRRAYRMSTVEHQECIFAYYFYRLVSHASRVVLLYDSRTVGLHSSEMSRYLIQLIYSFGDKLKVNHRSLSYTTSAFSPLRAEVAKDERVMGMLRKYLTPASPSGEKVKALSASAINTLIDCPLQFYLRFVEGFNVDEADEGYMTSSMVGTIMHAVMERLYMTISPQRKLPVTVTRQDIERWLDRTDSTIKDLTTEIIAKEYLKEEARRSDAFAGEPELMGKMIERIVSTVLKEELSIAPFEVLATEHKISGQVELCEGLKVNVTGSIDRIDRVNGTLRIIDYKTGEDELSTISLQDAFDPIQKKRPKAFVQLMFYCQALVANRPGLYGKPITPMIYSIKNVYSRGLEPLRIGPAREKADITDYQECFDEYKELMATVIRDLFNPEIPFTPTQAPDGHVCRYCNFKAICGVTDDNG